MLHMKPLTYLALGDSYTVGEQVRLYESFPYQTVYRLRRQGLALEAPEIVAVTGFTSSELLGLLEEKPLLPEYQAVSLLIGVNNQYRGLPLPDFAREFGLLLHKAIAWAGGRASRVWVLSIPDWGVTPFAEGRDRKQIAEEIDAFNAVCREAAQAAGVAFIDITPAQRSTGHAAEYLAADRLHPSGREYAKWAEQLAGAMAGVLQEK